MTKLWRRAAAILMAGLLTVGMAACSGGGNNSSTAENGGTSSSAEGGDTAEGDSVDMGDYQPVGSTDTSEVTKLVVWNTGSAETEDCNEVAAAVSDITRDLIGVEVELIRGQDNDQINLALSSGEVIDLLNYNNLSGQLSTCVRNSWATALDDLVQIWGQGALEVINPTDLEANYFSGVLYSLPDQKDTSRNSGFSMRKDIVDELGITVPEVGTWDDMHEILVQVHEAYSSVDWSWPNQRITPVWEGNEADLWEQLEEFNTTGIVSPAMGFSWDSSSVQNQVTSVNNVISEYNNALRWGTMDPSNIDQLNADLEAAGINEIVAEKQRQLDEFLATKGDSAEDGDTSEVSSEASVVSSEAAE